jgi:hypothetical protein
MESGNATNLVLYWVQFPEDILILSYIRLVIFQNLTCVLFTFTSYKETVEISSLTFELCSRHLVQDL